MAREITQMQHGQAKALETQRVEYSKELWEALRQTFSEGRQKYYLDRALQSAKGAFELHQWNTELSESLYVPLQAFEIALRNRLDRAMTKHYTDNHIECEWYEDVLEQWRDRWCATPAKRKEEDHCYRRIGKMISEAKRNAQRDIKRRQEALPVTFTETGFRDVFIAATEFGLWVHLLDKHLEKLWNGVLSEAFPQGTDRHQLYEFANRVRRLRNRVTHYEPVFEEPLLELHQKMLAYIHSWSDETGKWVSKTSRFEEVWKKASAILNGRH